MWVVFTPLSINVLCVPFVMIYFALFFEMTREQVIFPKTNLIAYEDNGLYILWAGSCRSEFS